MAEEHNDKRPSRDRRRRLRASVVCDGEYVALDGGMSSSWERCSLLDLSLDGAALEVHAGELHPGQQILLRLDDESSRAPVELEAVVMNRRRRSDPNVYGLVFPALAPREKKQLLRIVITAYRDSAPSPR
jgi:c-di-GMP-binding flagellar brake protein YcgR